jgi:hypothetical protein
MSDILYDIVLLPQINPVSGYGKKRKEELKLTETIKPIQKPLQYLQRRTNTRLKNPTSCNCNIQASSGEKFQNPRIGKLGGNAKIRKCETARTGGDAAQIAVTETRNVKRETATRLPRGGHLCACQKNW